MRRNILELENVDKKYIYEPWLMSSPPEGYPKPIIELKAGRDRFLETAKTFRDDQKHGGGRDRLS